jgi:hypothetical protein
LNLPQSLPIPAWVESGARPKDGLDLLGLRQPAQVISTVLLNGVTTVTPSVRYLSVRSFIALCYAQSKLPDEWGHFRDYAARVETAVAFANLIENPNASGVLGSIEGKKIVDSSPAKFLLQPLVKQLAVNIYAGPSDQLALSFATDSGIPGLTKERGLALARIASANISQSELGSRFCNGEVIKHANQSQLEEFAQYVSVSVIPENEREFLTNTLIPEKPLATDLGRIGTYGALLHLAQAKQGRLADDALLVTSISQNDIIPSEFGATLDGWLRYCVRDQIAVVHEVVFEQVIETLSSLTSSGNYTNGDEIITTYINEVDDQAALLQQLRLLRRDEDFRKLSFRQLYNRIERATRLGRQESDGLYRWRGELDELALIKTTFAARNEGTCAACMLPVAWVLSLFRSPVDLNLPDDSEDFLSHQGWARIGLREVIHPYVQKSLTEDQSFVQVIADLTRRTVDQHLRVVWSRLAQDPLRDVAVLNADGEIWGYRTDFRSGRTASRLRQAISWLQQLKLINDTGLTADGELVLNRALNALRFGVVE